MGERSAYHAVGSVEIHVQLAAGILRICEFHGPGDPEAGAAQHHVDPSGLGIHGFHGGADGFLLRHVAGNVPNAVLRNVPAAELPDQDAGFPETCAGTAADPAAAACDESDLLNVRHQESRP